MKRSACRIAAVLILFSVATAARAATYYWDVNGTEAGATPGANGIGDGTWDTAAANWNSVADGTGATTAWVDGNAAIFAAGSDLGSDPAVGGAFITAAAGRSPTSLTIEE